jgi:hypothetical protein
MAMFCSQRDIFSVGIYCLKDTVAISCFHACTGAICENLNFRGLKFFSVCEAVEVEAKGMFFIGFFWQSLFVVFVSPWTTE